MSDERTKAKNIMMIGTMPLLISGIIALLYGIITNTLEETGMNTARGILQTGAICSFAYYILLAIYIYLPEKVNIWRHKENE